MDIALIPRTSASLVERSERTSGSELGTGDDGPFALIYSFWHESDKYISVGFIYAFW